MIGDPKIVEDSPKPFISKEWLIEWSRNLSLSFISLSTMLEERKINLVDSIIDYQLKMFNFRSHAIFKLKNNWIIEHNGEVASDWGISRCSKLNGMLSTREWMSWLQKYINFTTTFLRTLRNQIARLSLSCHIF